MGEAEVEGEGELLVWTEGVGGGDAGDEGVGMAGEVEAGFVAKGLDKLNHGLDCASSWGVRLERGAGEVFGADAQDDWLGEVGPQ